jgi:putative redox protein
MSLITITHVDGLSVQAEIGHHRLVVDVSAAEGGADTGPSPVELFTAALGSCMAMHVAKYCQAARLPYQGFTLDLDFQLARDPLRVGALTVDLNLPAGFPESRKGAARRAALQCTVRNTLKEDTMVDLEVQASATQAEGGNQS